MLEKAQKDLDDMGWTVELQHLGKYRGCYLDTLSPSRYMLELYGWHCDAVDWAEHEKYKYH